MVRAASTAPGLSEAGVSPRTGVNTNVAPDFFYDRDLCRAEVDDGQLALGRRTEISPHRQGARRAALGSGD